MFNQYLFLSLFLSLIISCKQKEFPVQDSQLEQASSPDKVVLNEQQMKNFSLDSCSIKTVMLPNILKANGRVEALPNALVSVHSPISGLFQFKNILTGTRVAKGEILGSISDPMLIQMQEDYLMLSSKIEFAQIEFTRQRKLQDQEATSDKAFQMTNADVQQIQIQRSTIAEKLKLIGIHPESVSLTNIQRKINIVAPIGGIVNKIGSANGKYVTSSDLLFEIVSPDGMMLNLKLFETSALSLKQGQGLVAFANHDGQTKFDCTIQSINREVGSDGTVDVHCKIINNKELLLGMYMSAEIKVNNKKSNVLPTESILNYEGKNFVFTILGSNEFQMKELTLGVEENGYTEILNADQLSNQWIVRKGAYTLLMALKNRAE